MRNAVIEAVERRTLTHSRVSADLSGGMDSSIVASIAASRAELTAVT
ncbi:asparagine synthase-related protein [Streptomyces bauhiniae]